MTEQEKNQRIQEEREATMSILRTLRSLDVFDSADNLGIINRGESPDYSDGLMYPDDLVVKGTNQFVYFDKQPIDGKQGSHSLSEKHRVLYVGTFDLKTGKILSWGK
jgi:hypothetical protein